MNRSTVLLIALLLILGAIVLFLLPSEKERETSDKSPEVTFAIDSAAVVKLEIQRAPKLILIENIGGKWMITAPVRYQADPAAVARLIGGLSKFKAGSLISSNAEKQRLFQVDSSGTQVVVTDRSGKSTSLIIGKMGPSFSEVYFRLPASNDVYLGEGIDSWSLNKELKEWRDKAIFSQPSESIHDLSFVANGKQVTFHRDSTIWKSGERIVETNEINPVLNTLSSLRADDFVDTAMKFQSQPVTIAIQGTENITLNLYPSGQDSSKYVVQTSASPQIYVIGKYTAQQLIKPVEPGSTSKSGQVASISPTKKTPESNIVEENKTPEKKSSEITSVPTKKAVGSSSSVQSQQATSQPAVSTKKQPAPQHQAADIGSSKKTADKQTAPGASENKKGVGTKSPPVSSVTGGNTSQSSGDEEGELTVYTVKRGETMQIIAKKYGVGVEQILKWNLLKSITVKPGQELYIYVKK